MIICSFIVIYSNVKKHVYMGNSDIFDVSKIDLPLQKTKLVSLQQKMISKCAKFHCHSESSSEVTSRTFLLPY